MKFPVYSIRDLKVGFGFPFVSQSDAYASRDFQNQLSGDRGVMKFAPSDFQLFRTGEFDTDKGELIPCLPELICDGGSLNV